MDRVGLAVDGTLAAMAATVAELVAHPQVRHFSHDELDAAIGSASAA